MKNSTEGLNRRLDQAEEKISKLKDRIVELLNQKRKKEHLKSEDSCQQWTDHPGRKINKEILDLNDTLERWTKTHITEHYA